jgi:membrane-associated protease RseP (regulator of RpoE activity)
MKHMTPCGWFAGKLAVAIITVGMANAGVVPQEIITRLKDQDFQTRVTAEAELLEWAKSDANLRAIVLLEKVRQARDPEVRQRCHNVLRALAMIDYLRDGDGYLGINMNVVRAEVPGDEQGPREVIAVTQVIRDTPARQAGLRIGDLIIAIDDHVLKRAEALADFQTAIRALQPGREIVLQILRGGEMIEVPVTLGRRPPVGERFFFDDMHELDRRARNQFFREWLEKLDNPG